MPTIDQLAPTTAASDTDEFPVNQNGVTVKVTRAQVLSGVQPQLTLSSGILLGRASSGSGVPEQIAIGPNLSLANGTITAMAAPYQVASLPAGVVPSSANLIGIAQGGTAVSVTYGQFLSGLPTVPNVDISATVITPAGSTSQIGVASLLGSLLPLGGGTMTGALTLASTPTAAMQAATKSYVDSQIATGLVRTGGSLTGPLYLAGDPTSSPQAATKNYVDTQVATTLLRTGGTLSGSLTLAGDPVSPLHATTKQYADQHLLRAGDTLAGPLVLATDPVSPLQATTKAYVDTQVAALLPRGGGSLTGAVLLAGDPSLPLQAASKEYVDARLLRAGDSLSGSLLLASDPFLPLHASTKGYVDTQFSNALARSGGTMSGPVVLNADPVGPLQAATKEYVDTRLARGGDTLIGPLILASDPLTTLQAATKNYVDTQTSSSLSRGGGSLTGYLTLNSDPVSALQAATKHYVDTAVATTLPIGGGTLTGSLSLSAAPVTAGQAANKQYVDQQTAATLPISGGTLTGLLTLAAAPLSALHAATKQYVDASPGATGVLNVKQAPYSAKMDGATDDTAAFVAAYQAAPAGSVIYVPNGVTTLQPTGNWGVPLTKAVKWIVDGTTLPDGTPLADAIPSGTNPSSLALPATVTGNTVHGFTVSQAGSQTTDFAVLHTSYIVNHNGGISRSVVSNARTDTIIYNSPNDYVWGGVDRLVWAGIQTPTASAPAQHVGRYIQTLRQSVGLASNGSALPQPAMWAACLEYRDTTGYGSSWTNAALTVEMDWYGNGPDDAKVRQVQSLVIGQHSTAGAPVEISTVVGVYLAAGSSGHAYTVFGIGIPFSTSVLDTTNAQQMTGAAAIRLAAGHLIAFEPTVTYCLGFDNTTNSLRWYQGSSSYIVGKGITVGWESIYSSSATLSSSAAGNVVFLTGTSAYTIKLPPASSLAAGTGFTFSVTGSGAVTISPNGSDGIDLGPVTLKQNDRYHIVSDGSGMWREVFHTNITNPKFSGTPTFPTYTVANLPTSSAAGAVAFASNGRKPGEAAGAGTGVQVFNDGQHWISACSGAVVAA